MHQQPEEILNTDNKEEILETYHVKDDTLGVEITSPKNPKYHVIEPKLTPFEKELLKTTLRECRNILAKNNAEKTKEELFKRNHNMFFLRFCYV